MKCLMVITKPNFKLFLDLHVSKIKKWVLISKILRPTIWVKSYDNDQKIAIVLARIGDGIRPNSWNFNLKVI